MSQFAFEGRNTVGAPVRGRLEAVSASGAASQLLEQGITPVRIDPARGTDVFDSLRRYLGEGRVSMDDLIFFSRQMYTLQRAGVPILQALRGLRDSSSNAALARVIQGIHDALDSGSDLTSALSRYPGVFPKLYISLVQVGETTGSLDVVFRQLALYLEQEKLTRQRVKSAMRYPLFVMAAITIALGIVNVFVIPAFARVYTGFDAELPWATRIIIATSDFTLRYWPMLLMLILAAVFAVVLYLRSEPGRLHWDRIKLRLPIVGVLLHNATLSRFSHSLSMSLRAGIPVVQTLSVIASACGNEHIARQIHGMREGVERGEALSRMAQASGAFTPVVLQMMRVGEESGAVDELMDQVGFYYEQEVEYALKSLSAAIEPVLIIAVGGLVLVLALGVFMPMWNLINVMGPGR